MSQDTTKSIFSRLDTNLLQETARQQEASKQVRKQATKQRSNEATMQASNGLLDTLLRKLQNNRYLTANTFRYRPEELEDLNKLFEKLDKMYPKKVTRNDLVRAALIWLIEDFKSNEKESLLTRLLARM